MKTKTKIDWSGLEAFRATLPTISKELDFQHEHYRFLFMVWDIVKARYILQKYPRDSILINVADTIDTLGLPKEVLPMHRASLLYIDESRVMGEEIDLEQPVIIARTVINGQRMAVFIDGMHRVVKAYRTGVATLPAQMLTVEEALACKVG